MNDDERMALIGMAHPFSPMWAEPDSARSTIRQMFVFVFPFFSSVVLPLTSTINDALVYNSQINDISAYSSTLTDAQP